MSAEWNNFSEDRKDSFRKETEEEKKRYEIQMKEYKAKKAAEPAPVAEPVVKAKKGKAAPK